MAGEGPPFRGALGCRALGILLRMSVGGAASPQSQVEDVPGVGWGRGWGREGVEGGGEEVNVARSGVVSWVSCVSAGI